MNCLEAKFCIVTPMFLGGANQEPEDGIRPPSVKGALRFWWRALNWGRFWQEAKQDETQALRDLHQKEAHLFGAALDVKKKTVGQGCFLLSVTSKPLTTTDKGSVHPSFKNTTDARYLAYGLMGAFGINAARLEKGCINENQYFTVKLIFKGKIEPSLKEALIAWGLLGGLGSRVRKGLGSIALQTIKENDAIVWNYHEKIPNQEAYATTIAKLLAHKNNAINPAPYSCFDQGSRVEILHKGNTPYVTLNYFAKQLLKYRAWGFRGKLSDRSPSEKNFPNDHDWKYRRNRDSNRRANPNDLPDGFHPQRVVFGLPHNYSQSGDDVTPKNFQRRSSPLLLHIHPLSERQFIAVSVFLPTVFLPEGEQIKAGDKSVTVKIEYQLIHDFLDKYFSNTTILMAGSKK
jgi:CRISPR-associated protein Cmr1